MKNNRITRKIRRMELLEMITDELLSKIEELENDLKIKQQELKDTIEEKEEYRIEWIQERIEDATIRIEETKKLVADIEKMA